MKTWKAILFLDLVLNPILTWAAPQIQIVGQKEYNFGSIIQGEKVSYIFNVMNNGWDTLHISSVKTSCGCTAALLTSDHLAGGDTASINVSFNSEKFEGDITKTVSIYSNDAQKPIEEVKILGRVQVELVIDPHFVYLNNIKKSSPFVGVVSFKNQGSSKIRITKTNTSTGIKMIVPLKGKTTTVQPRQTLEVKFKVATDRVTDRYDGFVTLTTDHPRKPEIEIKVRGKIVE